MMANGPRQLSNWGLMGPIGQHNMALSLGGLCCAGPHKPTRAMLKWCRAPYTKKVLLTFFSHAHMFGVIFQVRVSSMFF